MCIYSYFEIITTIRTNKRKEKKNNGFCGVFTGVTKM